MGESGVPAYYRAALGGGVYNGKQTGADGPVARMKQSPKLILVDGSSYLFRAFFALPPLTGPGGRPTGAIYGVANMLNRLREDEQPDRMGVVFDAPGPTFRHELYADYKAHRPPTPEDLRAQVPTLLALIKALGYPLLQEDGVEADDVLGALARRGADAGYQVVVSTADKDLAQLVDARVTLVDTMKNERLDAAGVEKKFGVPPARICDYLALVGDKSDNIPGAPGVGPKTAAKLLAQYGDLPGVLAHAEEIKGKAGAGLRDAAERLPLMRELVEVRSDLDLPVAPDDLRLAPQDDEALRALYRECGFAKWLDALAEPAPPALAADWQVVLDEAALRRCCAELRRAKRVALAVDGGGAPYMQARARAVAFVPAPDAEALRIVCVPFAEAAMPAPGDADLAADAADPAPAATGLPRERALALLKPLLEAAKPAKLGHDLKRALQVLRNDGVALAGIGDDVMLESYVLDPAAGRHDLDGLAHKYPEVGGVAPPVAESGTESGPEPGPATGARAARAARLHARIADELGEADRRIYADIEMPLIEVLADMERRGVLLDTDSLRRQSRDLERDMAGLEEEIFELAGRSFNLGSPEQLAQVLFEEQGLPALRKTPKGRPSTAEDVLRELERSHAMPRLILRHRMASKLRSTYTAKLPELADCEGRVHTTFHQAVTATGRLSSSDPNLQNIPIRTAEGRRIRRAFVAAPGQVIVSADYSQIELRLMAHLSGDARLVRAFEDGLDIHAATAAEVFGVPLDQVDAGLRRRAKAINFGLIYGLTPFGLARQLGIAQAEAARYAQVYFERYAGVRRFMDGIKESARRQGFVETIFGRRLRVREIASRNPARRQYAERAAINAPMQGSAADIIKRAMIDLHRRLADTGARLILQVHDELVLEVAAAEAERVTAECRRRMEAAASLAVPLAAEVRAGRNWDEAH